MIGLRGFAASRRRSAISLGRWRYRNLRVSAGRPDQRSRRRGDFWSRPCATAARLIGGCPTWTAIHTAQLEKLFDLAQAFDVDVDLHLDFDSRSVVAASRRGLPRRPSAATTIRAASPIGHATKLSALPPARIRRRRGKAGARRRRRHGAACRPTFISMGRDATARRRRAALTPAHRLVGRRAGAWSPPTTCSIRSRRSATPRRCGWRTSTPTSRMSQRQRVRRLPRSGDEPARAPDEPARLRHRARQPGRPRRAGHVERRAMRSPNCPMC